MKLTNRDISENYSNAEYWFMPSDFRGAFSYWVAAQNPNGTYVVDRPLEAFMGYIKQFFPNPEIPERFSYDKLIKIISEERLGKIPEVLELNQMEPDFIDLYALARNVFYMMLREQITQA